MGGWRARGWGSLLGLAVLAATAAGAGHAGAQERAEDEDPRAAEEPAGAAEEPEGAVEEPEGAVEEPAGAAEEPEGAVDDEPGPAAPTEAPRVHLEVDTDCPRFDVVASSLSPWVQPAEQGAFDAWRVTVQRHEGTSRLLLHEPSGELSLERRIESDDCAALAQAFAFVVHARFVELEMLPAEVMVEAMARRQQPPPTAPPRDAPPPGSERELEPGPERLQREQEEEPPEPPPDGLGMWIAASAGGDFTLDPSTSVASFGLVAGLRPGGRWLAGRIALSASLPSEQAGGGERVELFGATARAEIATELRAGSFAIRPGAGLGLALRRAVALSVEGEPSAVRFHPLISATVPITWRATSLLGVRLAGVLQFLPIGDRYIISPTGPIARSPRLSFLLHLGLELNLGE